MTQAGSPIGEEAPTCEHEMGKRMSSDSYAVGAPVLLNAYWHVHVAELILDGAEPREANETAWKSYYYGGLLDYARNDDSRSSEASSTRAEYPGGIPPLAEPLAVTPDKGPHKHWTTRCLVAALVNDERLLATSWDDLTRQYGHCARAQISIGHTRSLQWQCRMMWLLATGTATSCTVRGSPTTGLPASLDGNASQPIRRGSLARSTQRSAPRGRRSVTPTTGLAGRSGRSCLAR